MPTDPARIQLVGRDGCFMMDGVRVRAAPGWHEEQGSLADEADRGVRTPLAGEGARREVLGCCAPEHFELVASLPVAVVMPDGGDS